MTTGAKNGTFSKLSTDRKDKFQMFVSNTYSTIYKLIATFEL